jgi:carbonic anhydrase/acetyltransferase-like protein (isoleucine patch superfamily)
MHEEIVLTASVPVFGRVAFDACPQASYAAAARGDFPTIRVGRKIRVPLRVALRQIVGDDPAEIDRMIARFREVVSKKKRAA